MNTRRGFAQCLAPLLPARRLLATVIALLAFFLAAPLTHAQMGMMGLGGEMGDLVKPSHNPRLLKEYAQILGLSADQKRAADELLVAYQTEFRDSVSRLEEIYQSISEEAQDSGEWELYQQAFPNVMVKFMKKAEKLNNTFMSDLKAILDDQQAARFDGVERLHRRKSSFKMDLSGLAGVDLFETVAGLRLDPGAGSAAAAALDQYSVELDRELISRDKMFRGFLDDMAKFLEKGESFNDEPEFMQKWMKDMNESGKRLEAVNARYVPTVRAALPESEQTAFDTQIKKSKYPAIYKETYAGRVFDAVDKMSDLDATQKEGIKTLKESYTRDSAAADDKWAGVQDDLKANLSDEQSMFGQGVWMIRQDPKYVEARDARKGIDDKAVEAVKALLTEAQRAKLPKKNYRPEWDFDRAQNP